MSKGEKKGLVPELRFPEFRGADEWKSKRLGSLSTILRGGSPRPIEYYLTTDEDGLNWLKIGDVDKGAKYISHTKEKVKETALNKTREVHPGDLIMSNSMSFGRPYIMQIKSCIHDGWIAVTDITKNINRDYLYYYVLSNNAQTYFINAAAGGGIKNLNADIIKLLSVIYPKEKGEQQKIADCLTSIDELITAQTQKLDALKAHKKGLMQQLFPAEGETLPKRRFPEFRGKGEWESKSLGSAAHFSSGGTPSKTKADYWGGTIPWISAASMYDSDLNKSDLNITQKAVEDGARIAKKNSLLILVRGSMLYNRVPMGIATIDVAFNQDVKALTISGGINVRFMLYQLLAFESRMPIDKTGIGAGKIETDELKGLSVFIPKKAEQNKIANCLTSIDDLITAQAQKIDALKTHKKGLMQQLFPAMEDTNA